MSRTPANSVAETIVDIEEKNVYLEIQVSSYKAQAIEFQAQIDRNNATITELEPLAVWAEIPTVDPLA